MSDWQETAKPWFWKNGMYDVKGMAEEIERLRAENLSLKSHHTAILSAATRAVEAHGAWEERKTRFTQDHMDGVMYDLERELRTLKPREAVE